MNMRRATRIFNRTPTWHFEGLSPRQFKRVSLRMAGTNPEVSLPLMRIMIRSVRQMHRRDILGLPLPD